MNVDLHTHVSLKTMLGAVKNAERNSCWFTLKSNFLDALSGGILGSQSSLNQMKSGNIQMAVTPLYSLEHAFSKSWLLKDVVTKIEKKLSKKYLTKIRDNQLSPYVNLCEELQHVRDSENSNMVLIESIDGFDPGKMNLILALEGLHSFQDKYIDSIQAHLAAITKNFTDFIIQNRVLYVGLSHLTRNPICTHSYAMKMINDLAFIPEGSGLTDMAKAMIDLCYSGTAKFGKKVLIDIKHMGLNSRLQFYEYRKHKNYTSIPIVASHVAVTGCSFNNIKINSANASDKYEDCIEVSYQHTSSDVVYKYETSPQLEYVDFNPWSLNLFDEEIENIIQSEGMIGLILDMRVLGSKGEDFGDMDPEGSEYFSKASYERLKAENRFNTNPDPTPITDPTDTVDIDSIVGLKSTMHLFANLLHIIRTYHKQHNNLKAWDHVCIGSDSDGLIQPIKEYQNATNFDDLREAMFEVFEEERKRDHLKVYFGTFDSRMLVNKLFYSNATKFINANL